MEEPIDDYNDFVNQTSLKERINQVNYSEILVESKKFLICNILLCNNVSVIRSESVPIGESDGFIICDSHISVHSLSDTIFDREFLNSSTFKQKLEQFINIVEPVRLTIRQFEFDNYNDLTGGIASFFQVMEESLVLLIELFKELRTINLQSFGWLINSVHWRSDINEILGFIKRRFHILTEDEVDPNLTAIFFKIFLKEAISNGYYPQPIQSENFNRVVLIAFKRQIELWLTNLKRSAEDIIEFIENTLNETNREARIRYLTEKDEDIHFDRKENVSNSVKKVISAFANTEGGLILIGQSDDGRLVGVDNPDRRIQTINQLANNLQPPVDVTILEHLYEGIILIEVQISKSGNLHQCDGRYYKRVNRDCIPMDHHEISLRFREMS